MQRADNTRRWATRHKDTSRAHRLSRRRTGAAWAPALPRCAVVSCARSLASAAWIAASAWRTAIVRLLDVNRVGQMSRMRVGLIGNTEGKWKGKCGNDSVYFLYTTFWPRYPRIASPSFGLIAASTNLLTFLLIPSPASLWSSLCFPAARAPTACGCRSRRPNQHPASNPCSIQIPEPRTVTTVF